MLRKISSLMSGILLTSLFFILVGSVPVMAAPASVTPHGTAKFANPTATVNLSKNSAKFRRIWRQAIQAWNHTGAFHFVITKALANITTGTDSKLGADYPGMTYISLNKQGYLHRIDVELNPQALKIYRYSTSEMVNVAEHELGHVIGLNHNPNVASVMYPANRFYGIQKVDVEGVEQFYGTQLNGLAMANQTMTLRQPAVDVRGQRLFDGSGDGFVLLPWRFQGLYWPERSLLTELQRNAALLKEAVNG